MKDRDERRTLAKLSGPARELVRVTCCELCSQRASNRERPERIEAAERRAAAGEACESCGEPFDASRVDARYCYGACRSARTGGASNNDTLHLVSYSRNTLRRVRPRRGGMGVGDGAPRRPRRGWSRSSSNTRMMLTGSRRLSVRRREERYHPFGRPTFRGRRLQQRAGGVAPNSVFAFRGKNGKNAAGSRDPRVWLWWVWFCASLQNEPRFLFCASRKKMQMMEPGLVEEIDGERAKARAG